MTGKQLRELNWKTVALDTLEALRLLNNHYDDLSRSNPGFMGKMCLQNYALWNDSLLESEKVLYRYREIKTFTKLRRRKKKT